MVCLESDSISMQLIKCIGDFGQCTIGIWEGKGGPESKFLRTAANEVASELVALTSEFPRVCVIVTSQIYTRRADTYNRFANRKLFHELQMGFFAPWLASD